MQGLDLPDLAGEGGKTREGRRTLIPKEKEAGKGKQCVGDLAKQTVVSGQDPVSVKIWKVKTHTTKAEIRKLKLFI